MVTTNTTRGAERLNTLLRELGRGSQAAAARILGCSDGAISKIKLGKKKPGRELALRIEDWSRGLINPRDWDLPAKESSNA